MLVALAMVWRDKYRAPSSCVRAHTHSRPRATKCQLHVDAICENLCCHCTMLACTAPRMLKKTNKNRRFPWRGDPCW